PEGPTDVLIAWARRWGYRRSRSNRTGVAIVGSGKSLVRRRPSIDGLNVGLALGPPYDHTVHADSDVARSVGGLDSDEIDSAGAVLGTFRTQPQCARTDIRGIGREHAIARRGSSSSLPNTRTYPGVDSASY